LRLPEQRVVEAYTVQVCASVHLPPRNLLLGALDVEVQRFRSCWKVVWCQAGRISIQLSDSPKQPSARTPGFSLRGRIPSLVYYWLRCDLN